jgi:uncharacterized protein YchJ
LKNIDSYPFAPEYEGLNILEALSAGRLEVAVVAYSDAFRHPQEELMPAEKSVFVKGERRNRHE